MTALLSVSKNETEKVALYAADCRRLGIAVNPPDVNQSSWDFSIEDPPGDARSGKASIRFGMGAVKNVGQGPVDAILEGRQKGGIFMDLNDFARRVDLRHVGKRALESLIKVGALDAYGPRPALLASQDRILSVSAANFRAADQGQMSLFGAHTGIVDEIVLPRVGGEVSQREILNWERELIGLYVSDHPLSPVMNTLSQAVTHFSAQLAEALPNERVRVAGMVTRLRPHQTKTGKAMAFVTLEDLQGNIELVVFPKTWERYNELLDFDHIVLVEGKVDLGGAEPKVLVDSVTTEFKLLDPILASTAPANGALPGAKSQANPSAQGERAASRPAISDPPASKGWENGSLPPPPEAFPPDWGQDELAPGGFVLETTRPAPGKVMDTPAIPEMDGEDEREALRPASVLADSLPANEGVVTSQILVSERVLAEPAAASLVIQAPEPPVLRSLSPAETPAEPVRPLPYIPPPTMENENVRMVTVMLRPTGDKLRDNLRMRQAYGALISYPGSDRFAFMVHERGRSYQIEFPNFTIGLNPELLSRLQRLVGVENVLVENLTFQ